MIFLDPLRFIFRSDGPIIGHLHRQSYSATGIARSQDADTATPTANLRLTRPVRLPGPSDPTSMEILARMSYLWYSPLPMQWTRFDDSMVPKAVRETRVTLNPQGDFYLNEGAVADLGDPVAVRLLFNKEEGKIGIAAAPMQAKGAMQLSTKYGRSAASRKFRALNFCRHLGILPDRTIMFLDPKLENGVLVLNIHSTVIAPRRGAPAGSRSRERN